MMLKAGIICYFVAAVLISAGIEIQTDQKGTFIIYLGIFTGIFALGLILAYVTDKNI